MSRRSNPTNTRDRIAHPESGQTAIILLLMLSTFLLAVMAFAVDLTNLWFHRDATQTAADAACQAGSMDMLNLAAGVTDTTMNFTPGTASNCASSSTSTICKYAGFNGYAGAGLSTTAPSNSVSWTFPASVAGATTPSTNVTSHPYLAVTVTENVKTWFMALLGLKYQEVAATCTCGLTEISSPAPLVVLSPTASGSLTYGGGATITIIGGPQRTVQINSTSTTAVVCDPSGSLNTSGAGPNSTGGDIGVTGAETTPASGFCWGGGNNSTGLDLGTGGNWRSPTAPAPDPYGYVPAPSQPATSTTATGPHVVSFGQDGCPDNAPTNYVSTTPHSGCYEYEPGYYSSGISQAANDVVIFKPGLYYMNGSVSIGGSDDVRNATPCSPSCSSYSTTTGSQTDGVMFYFASGSFSVSGGSGALSSSRVTPVNSTALTCNGTVPNASLGMPSTLNGNVLVAECTTYGTYTGWSSSDVASTSGSRGLLLFQSHSNPVSSSTDIFSGSGALAFGGTMYYHGTSYNSYFNLNGSGSVATYVIGEIIADNVNLSGSAGIKMALNASSSQTVLKAGILQ